MSGNAYRKLRHGKGTVMVMSRIGMRALRCAAIALGIASAAIVANAGPNVIFDTDMAEGCDDVGALAVLHALADDGKCRIIAMGTCTRDNQSVAAVEIVNGFYGRWDIPVGCSKEIGVVGTPDGNPARPGHQKYARLADEYADWVKHRNSNDAPDACDVYRKALASAPDNSVAFISTGFMTNMRRLLETKGGAHSPLDGRALVSKKVKAWYAMACRDGKRREYNVMHDVASAKIAFAKWPSAIFWADFDLGAGICSGRRVAETAYGFRNPVKDVFSWSLPSREAALAKGKGGGLGGRSSWGGMAVLAAVDGVPRYFSGESGVYRILDDSGTTEWFPDKNGRTLRLVSAAGRQHRVYKGHNYGAILDELIARIPKCRRDDETITAYRQYRLERTGTGVRMAHRGKTLWNLEIDNPEGRPFFHPLTLPSGRTLTDLRPKDHVWHLGYWFSWKYVNGVNYWEPADAQRKGAEPEGRTRVVKKSVGIDGLDCNVRLELEYGPRSGNAMVLEETRNITVDPPDRNGGYTITVRHAFKALADVTLGRTPPHGSAAEGKWGGGYAGATLRLAPEAASSFGVQGYGGGDSPARCTASETKFIDFTDPATGEGVTFTQLKAPPSGKFYVWPDKRMINPSPVYDAPLSLKKGEMLELAYRLAVHADKSVKGTLARRPVEPMDRGLVASVSPRGTYVSWRMLETDARDVGFDLWRKDGGRVEKVNAAPIVQTSDFFMPGYTNAAALYSVDGKTFCPVRRVGGIDVPYVSFRLQDTNATVSAVAVGDLDGDGAYDYVVKTPSGGTDPWDLVWKPAPDTHKIEAYGSDGRFLWRRDMGWNIEMGIWYLPMVVADLDGDGKAEVVVKSAPLSPDFRDPDGRVNDGPEFLTVLDGMTGEIRAQTPWIPRGCPDPISDYNHFNSRNQIAIAHLDGKTPCVVIERGTYGLMVVEAYRFTGTSLERIWRFDNEFLPRRFKGQGDHACLCEDVDGDGFDEVLIGSLTLDHDGTVLWCNGRGHSDAHYYGDIDPKRPGMELFFVYETRQRNGGGLLMADPVTGEEIWKLPEETFHVHGSGICADIDPAHPGLEVYGQEAVQNSATLSKTNTHQRSDNRWLYTAAGELLCAYTNCTFGYGFGCRTVFWDADLQREMLRGGGNMMDHEGNFVSPRLPGSAMLVADLLGDWREEIVAAVRGEIRIYSTDIPAMDRRVSLMRDRSYRSRITMETSGYGQQPILGYVPSATAPGLSLRLFEFARRIRLDVNAPLDAPLKGVLTVDGMPEGWTVDFGEREIDLPPGGHWKEDLRISRKPCPKGRFDFRATLRREGFPPLVLNQPLFL